MGGAINSGLINSFFLAVGGAYVGGPQVRKEGAQ